MMKEITVIVACKEFSFFTLLLHKLRQRNIILTITHCSNTDEVDSVFEPIETDMVIIDITWADIYMPSSTLIKKLLNKKPFLKIIGVTKDCNKHIVPRLKKSGVQGCFAWDTETLRPILDCIEKVIAGEKCFY